ncbi:hypothetical protein PILCRDRAFT_6759 [Piloderma croceum F 1598]|uniref:Uncharacterized protein n=1 Tax=Piloderma croceum (strain F 1598) TaxID=765440 RepID=A0A0C3C2S7_PILCF|nr:hypothetical protein PILCRDRAFT_6759 [Piloderma croceum F 1598]
MANNTSYVVGFQLQDLALPVTICMVLIATFILRQRRMRRVAMEARSNLPVLPNGKITVDPNKDREFGKWTAVPFTYPPIPPFPGELSSIKPIPYRPFQWGPDYHVTMGIRKMPWEDWIELDNQFTSYHRIRTHRIKTRGSNVVRVLPDQPGVVHGAGDAVIELVQELSEYLAVRYPSTFRIERDVESKTNEKRLIERGWGGALPVKSITNIFLGVTYELNENAEDMMRVAALLTQDDLALMIEGEDGRYYFQAGAICVGGSWRLRDKIGMRLDEIHTHGNVPKYREKLEMSLERFFKRLAVDKPVIRNNYFIQIVGPDEDRKNMMPNECADLDPNELAWSSTVNGSEDDFSPGNGGHGAISQKAILVSPSTIRFRTERQTLRRLPKSGAILFTIRTYIFPVTELGKERGIPARMASAIRSWPADVAKYKALALYEDVLLGYLDECARIQVEKGEVGEGEKMKAEYPF